MAFLPFRDKMENVSLSLTRGCGLIDPLEPVSTLPELGRAVLLARRSTRQRRNSLNLSALRPAIVSPGEGRSFLLAIA